MRFCLPLLLAIAVIACGPSESSRSVLQDAGGTGFTPGVDGPDGTGSNTPQPGTDNSDIEGTDGADGSDGGGEAPPNPQNGTLIGDPCTPGDLDCNGTSVVVCVADGAGWLVKETCTGTQQCDAATGACKCYANCVNKECGDDGCGGSCGSCADGAACSFGECGCTPACGGKQCGPDGCGGNCGTCEAGTTCVGNICEQDSVNPTPASCNPSGTGVTVGTQVKNVTWTNAEAKSISLHDYCLAEGAVVIVETAAW